MSGVKYNSDKKLKKKTDGYCIKGVLQDAHSADLKKDIELVL